MYLNEIITLIFGLCIGSFLNVCVYRLPLESMSLINPKTSICLKCKKTIKFYDNIPVLSYIFLMGKCRYCKTKIPIRLPIVELLSGCFALCTYLKFGLTAQALIYFALIASLLVVIFIDIDHLIIPDCISLPGIIIGFLASCFILQDMDWKKSLLGFFVGGGFFFLIAFLYSKLKKIEGLGGGDIKLLAMLGAFLGIKGVLFVIFIASAIGTVVGLIVMLSSKEKSLQFKIPFGPFLSFAAILYIFWGNEIILWYINFIR